MTMNAHENFVQLQQWVYQQGIAKMGVTQIDEELKTKFYLSPDELQDFQFAISLAVRLSQAVLESLKDRPTLLYKWHYRQANNFLDAVAFRLADKIQQAGYHALPIAASQIIDWKEQLGHLSHRHVAEAAGLGWIGRNNLLVTPEFGAQVRLVTVLTSMPLEIGEELPFSCGSCHNCISACPAGALGEGPQDYNYEKCFTLMDHFARKLNIGVHICGLCVKACPGNSKLQ